MQDDEAAGQFPPPDAGQEVADEPDPAFDETDDEEAESPDEHEPEPDDDEEADADAAEA